MRRPATTFAGAYWRRVPGRPMSAERWAEVQRLQRLEWRGTFAQHAGRLLLDELADEIARLRREAGEAKP